MMVYLFKVLYILRKKRRNLLNRYLLREIKYLFSERVFIGNKVLFDTFPHFNWDESKSRISINEGVAIRGSIFFQFFENGFIEIGKNTFFNNSCSITSLVSVKVGENCLFGEGVKVYDHNHSYQDNSLLIREQGYSKAPVSIGNNCWIGSNTVILKGVTIGDNCVIGANCIIHKSVAAGTVVYQDAEQQKLKEYRPKGK